MTGVQLLKSHNKQDIHQKGCSNVDCTCHFTSVFHNVSIRNNNQAKESRTLYQIVQTYGTA